MTELALPDTTPKEQGFTEYEAIALNQFRMANPPAQVFSDATKFFNTEQIYEKLCAQLGELSFMPIHLHQWLTKQGYNQSPIGEMDVVWLLE